ncbi:MAG: hypothetical protein E7557_01125 [Ruminococcaceae bacterium]|nr:hypothetical protein [Oscillospiraceae bacterium]
MLFYICLALGIINLILFLIQRKPEVSLRVLFFKTTTSCLMILTALAAYYENQSCSLELALLFFAGCVCGLLGDIWLDAKYIFKAEENGLLKAGFTSFLIGHIFYSFAMFIAYGVSTITIICGVIGIAFGPFSCWFTEKTMKAEFGKSKLISLVYTAVLGFTTGVAVAVAIENDFALFSILRVVGMVLFFASDAVLAQIYFCKNKNTRLNVVINHLLYYGAQFLMASSLFVS